MRYLENLIQRTNTLESDLWTETNRTSEKLQKHKLHIQITKIILLNNLEVSQKTETGTTIFFCNVTPRHISIRV
jgi:hypothetical protein